MLNYITKKYNIPLVKIKKYCIIYLIALEPPENRNAHHLTNPDTTIRQKKKEIMRRSRRPLNV
jgi:hypothetical protein